MGYARYRPTWPRGVQEVKGPRFLDSRHMKVVTPMYPLPQGISWYSFLEAESTPGTWPCRMLRKKSPVTGPGKNIFECACTNITSEFDIVCTLHPNQLCKQTNKMHCTNHALHGLYRAADTVNYELLTNEMVVRNM